MLFDLHCLCNTYLLAYYMFCVILIFDFLILPWAETSGINIYPFFRMCYLRITHFQHAQIREIQNAS